MPSRIMTRVSKLNNDLATATSPDVPLRRGFVILVLLGMAFWIGGIILAPSLAALPFPLARKTAAFIYFFYQPVCHQMPERSLWISAYPMAVCIRCLSFYMGGFLTAAICLFKGTTRLWPLGRYAFLGFPTLFDFLLEKFNIYHNIPALRVVTGLLLGFALVQILIIAIAGQTRNPLGTAPEQIGTESGT